MYWLFISFWWWKCWVVYNRKIYLLFLRCIYYLSYMLYRGDGYTDGEDDNPDPFICRLDTAEPTQDPSETPSKYPSKYPSKHPSKYPSKQPSKQPSKYPSKQPS
eukprot:534255_1